MRLPGHAVGQVIFVRTDVPEYSEVAIAFQSLEELVSLCTCPQPGRTLERVVIFTLQGEEPIALTLGFISASKGVRSQPAGTEVNS